MANKVKYNLKNVHYAVATTGGYSTPVAMSGAVNITLSPKGDDYVFYADGLRYFEYHTNNGYEGTLEMALIPEDFRTTILGEVSTGGKVFELDDVQITTTALLPVLTWLDRQKKKALRSTLKRFPSAMHQKPVLQSTGKIL